MPVLIMNRPDRLGSNMIGHIAQIILADYKNYYIEEIKDTRENKSGADLNNSFLIECLNEIIHYLNKNRIKNSDKYIILVDQNDEYYKLNNTYCLRNLNLNTCLKIKQDIFSFFKEKYFSIISNRIDILANEKGYKIDYNWKQTICLHLRLDDIYFNSNGRGNNSRFEYNGMYSSQYYINKINDDDNKTNENEKMEFLRNIIPLNEQIKHPNIDHYDCQTIMNIEILRNKIKEIKNTYPNHKVLIVASPYGEIEIESDYVVRSNDPNYDLYCMINSDILICSKSNFALTAAFFHKGSQLYIPMWGHFASMGFQSKYDKTSNIEYFY